MKFDKNIVFYALLYIGIVSLTYLFFLFQDVVKNRILFSIVFSLLILILIIFLRKKTLMEEPSEGVVRYVMSCKDCSWEWMSNITEKEESPKSCPHCKSKNIETIGWRKIKTIQKKEADLRKFLS